MNASVLKRLAAIAGIIGSLALMAEAAIAGPKCTCRYAGKNFQVGDVACIRGRLAQCNFVLNNTNWKFIADICPVTQNPPDIRRRLAGLARADAAMTRISRSTGAE